MKLIAYHGVITGRERKKTNFFPWQSGFWQRIHVADSQPFVLWLSLISSDAGSIFQNWNLESSTGCLSYRTVLSPCWALVWWMKWSPRPSDESSSTEQVKCPSAGEKGNSVVCERCINAMIACGFVYKSRKVLERYKRKLCPLIRSHGVKYNCNPWLKWSHFSR